MELHHRPVRDVLYPEQYAWLILLAALDVMLTCAVLFVGGREANAVANWILGHYDIPGLAIFKFLTIVVVICMCEWVGRLKPAVGRRLALTAIGINILPVLISITLLLS